MNRRSFLASLAALFAAPIAALGLAKGPKHAPQQWSKDGYYGTASPRSIYDLIDAEMASANMEMRRGLAKESFVLRESPPALRYGDAVTFRMPVNRRAWTGVVAGITP